MEINCPKCNKPLKLLNEDLHGDSTGDAGKTVLAGGILCDDCGLIPFEFEAEVEPDFEVGCEAPIIAHFRLKKPLGKGGFGVVWLAEDINLERLVALKMPTTSKQSVAMLLHEAQSAAKLRHPNIVSIYETGISKDGQAFIASEYIDGLNLRDILTAGRPTLTTTIDLLITVSDALAHAHHAGIIHRDIKPANIMIDQKGIPYVADFGLAKHVSANESISAKGQILGTVNYMSPEQATGITQITDHRTDVYAVGVVLFEMLTGHLPFRGNARAAIHQKTTQDAPSPRILEPLIAKDLETLCLKCLERDPDKRMPTALMLKQELERVKRGEPILARPIGPIEKVFRWSKRYPLIAGLSSGLVLSLMAGLIGVTFFWQDALRNADLARNSVYRSLMSLAAQNYEQGNVRGIQSVMDRIASDENLKQLRDFSWNYYDQVLACFSTNVVHGDQVNSVAISGDNRLFATIGQDGHCAVWNAETGELLKRVHPKEAKYTAVAFSPTRLHMATGDSKGFFSIWNPNELNVPLKTVHHGPVVTSIRYSIDGKYLLTFGKQGPVRVWQLDSEELIAEIPSGPLGTNSAEFTPDGTQVIAGGDQGILRIWSLSDKKSLDIRNGSKSNEESITSICVSSDGKQVAVAGANGNYRIYSAENGELLKEKYTFQGMLGSINFLKGGRFLTCTGTVQSMEVYDIETGRTIGTYPTHRLGAGVGSLSYDGRLLAVGSGDGTAKVLRVDQLQQPKVFWHDSPVYDLAFSRDSGAILSLGPSGEILSHAMRDGKVSVLLDKSESEYRMFEFDTQHDQIIRAVPQPVIDFTSLDRSDPTRKSRLPSLTVPHRPITGIFLNPKKEQLLVVGRLGDVMLYNLAPTVEIQEDLTLALGETVSVAGSIELQQLAVGFEDGQIFLIGLNSLKILHQLQTNGIPSSLGFCGKSLIVGLNTGIIEKYDLKSNPIEEPRQLEGHGAQVTAIMSFPDSRTFATGSRDHLIKIWDLASGDCITTLYGHNRQIFSLIVSPDGKTLVSGGLEGDIRIWKSDGD